LASGEIIVVNLLKVSLLVLAGNAGGVVHASELNSIRRHPGGQQANIKGRHYKLCKDGRNLAKTYREVPKTQVGRDNNNRSQGGFRKYGPGCRGAGSSVNEPYG
jgi:hypothetical protein